MYSKIKIKWKDHEIKISLPPLPPICPFPPSARHCYSFLMAPRVSLVCVYIRANTNYPFLSFFTAGGTVGTPPCALAFKPWFKLQDAVQV